jgi:hypothetical protein
MERQAIFCCLAPPVFQIEAAQPDNFDKAFVYQLAQRSRGGIF